MALLMSAISNDGKDDRSDGNRQEHRRLPLDQDECCRRSIDSIGGGSFDLCWQHAQHQKQPRHTWRCRNVMLSTFWKNYDTKTAIFPSCRNWPMSETTSLQNWENRGCNILDEKMLCEWKFENLLTEYQNVLTLDNHFRLLAQSYPSVDLTHCPELPPVKWIKSCTNLPSWVKSGNWVKWIKWCQNQSISIIVDKILDLGPMQLCIASPANKTTVRCFCGGASVQHLKSKLASNLGKILPKSWFERCFEAHPGALSTRKALFVIVTKVHGNSLSIKDFSSTSEGNFLFLFSPLASISSSP